jgi:hypothetical protein
MEVFGGLIPRVVPSFAAADPGRFVGRAGPARARPHHHRHRAHAVPGCLPALRRPFRAGPQPLHPHAGRPALAGARRRCPGTGKAVPVRERQLPAPDLHRAPARGWAAASPPHRAPGRHAAPDRLCSGRRTRIAPGRAACHAGQRRHAAAHDPDERRRVPAATGHWGRRLGLAARPALRHDHLRP